MQIPIAQVLELATGAAGFLQKIFANGSSGENFESLLKTALSGTDKAAGSFVEGLFAKLNLDDDALEGLFASGSGIFLFQFMAGLKNMGLDAKDLKALLSGDLKGISDERLAKFFATMGFDEPSVNAIMTDATLKTDILDALFGTMKDILKAHATETGQAADGVLAGIFSDTEAVDVLLAGIGPVGITEQAGKDNTLKAAGNTAAVLDPVQTQIRGVIEGVLKQSGVSAAVQSAVVRNRSQQEGVHRAAIKVENFAAVLEENFGIGQENLKELVFATDGVAREQLVDDITRKISAFLDKNEGKPLSGAVREALAFVKTFMTDGEFAGIENSLKLFQPTVMPQDRIMVGSDLYQALADRFADQPATALEKHMQQVMDQIRRGVAGNIKSSQGEVSLKLNPPMLGRVEVNVSMLEGAVNATFKADQAITRDILQQNMQVLKEALAEQGIKVTNVQVTTGFDERPQQSLAHNGFAGQEGRGSFSGNRGRSGQDGSAGHGTGAEIEAFSYAARAMDPLYEGGLDVVV